MTSNKMKKLIYISTVFLCVFLTDKAKAQIQSGSFGYYQDALRFSQGYQIGGTARIQGIAGAQSALGGDISTASVNPAGLGFFNKSEFSFTPTLSFGGTKASFIGNTDNEANTSFNISNLGFVFSKAKDAIVPGKWRGGSFAISMVRTNNFNNRFSYSGTNRFNSKIDSYVEGADGIDVLDLEDEIDGNGDPTSLESLAYYTFLLNPTDDDPTRYYSLIEGEEVLQSGVVTTSGAQYQWNFAYGGNYNDKLYIGANLGLTSIRYNREVEHTESILTNNDDIDDLRSFTDNENLKVRGSGINFSLGLIYRVNDMLRLGGSIVTPTYYYSIKETYENSIQADFNNNLTVGNPPERLEDQNLSMIPGEFSYKLTTPLKLTGGAAVFLGKKGFISADVDYVAYNTAKLQPIDNISFSADNKTISNIYKPTFNFRVGGEFREDIFRFRAGYAYYGDPTDNIDNLNRQTQFITAGAGIRLSAFYLDLAVVNSRYNSGFSPYTLSDGSHPSAQIKNTYTNGTITLGFHF